MAEFEQIYTKDQREKTFKKNLASLRKCLKNNGVSEEVLSMNAQLLSEASWYACNLQEINDIIARDGVVDFYKNGENQYGTKKSVAAELKPKYTSTYQALIRQLSELMPTETEKDAAAEIMEFINS